MTDKDNDGPPDIKIMVFKTIFKVLTVLWLLIGAFILYWTGYWYYQMQNVNDLVVIVIAVLFASGIYMLAIYVPITIILALIYFILKRKKKI